MRVVGAGGGSLVGLRGRGVEKGFGGVEWSRVGELGELGWLISFYF